VQVLVIGAGIMGTATALELARRGAAVTLLERAVPGAEASTAAAGILGAQAESAEAPEMLDTFLHARDAYPAWAAELRADTGIDVGYQKSGVLRLAFTEEDEAHARAMLEQSARRGALAEWVPDPWRIESHIARNVRGSVYFANDAQVEPQRLFRALLAAVAQTQIDVRTGVTVHALVRRSDDASAPCLGADTSAGRIEADAIVLAAGSFSALVRGGSARAREVRPIRGQMCELEERAAKVRTIVFGAGSYVVPRGDGRIVCGSTMEDVGFVRAVTAAGLGNLLLGATRAVPSLADAEVTRTWCSFRPFVPKHSSGPDRLHVDASHAGDQLLSAAPLVGACEVPNLFLATGHHRNGILLAKSTAEAVANAILG
jgi:glycine oxidase